ncbi:ABC transporter ATP-binding protein [bacterium]|nr:ABC transporter ATP-binding protein [bacterium]
MNTVEIKNLTKKFGSTVAIDNLSLNIEKGKITGLIGADGAGKTTLLRTIIGLLLPNVGEINVLGFNPKTQKNELNLHIGYMPQKFGLYEDLTVLENLKLYADLKGVNIAPHPNPLPKGAREQSDINKMLEFTTLAPFQDRLAGALSGGMKQKLGLACTLLGNPEFLLLDEPSVGVDPISRRDLMKMVREMINPETTVLWSTAYLDEAHSFDTAVVIDKGKVIYEGKPHDLAPTPQEFENKVIDLMGGYNKEESLIAKNYDYKAPNVDLTVEADNLEKRYGNFYAVKNNTFKIKKGEIFGLLGPNGAGKSTSFKMMCGLARPTSGTARIMGIDIKKNPERARANLGYMAQKFSLYGSLTVRENLDFFALAYGISMLKKEEKVNEVIDVFGLKEYENAKAEELPLGLKQRLSMAAALIHNPPVLFLDEPTSGVDVLTRRDFWNHIVSLSKKGVTIMVTTHFMDEAEYCDRISLFYKGETIAVGTPAELKQQAGANDMETAFINLIKESEK